MHALTCSPPCLTVGLNRVFFSREVFGFYKTVFFPSEPFSKLAFIGKITFFRTSAEFFVYKLLQSNLFLPFVLLMYGFLLNCILKDISNSLRCGCSSRLKRHQQPNLMYLGMGFFYYCLITFLFSFHLAFFDDQIAIDYLLNEYLLFSLLLNEHYKI